MTSGIDAEKMILGEILLRPEAFDVVEDMLLPRMFLDPAHNDIYGVIWDLVQSGKRLTRTAVGFTLGEKVDGKSTDAILSALIHTAEREENIPLRQYAEMIIDRFQRAEGQKILDAAKSDLDDKSKRPDDAIMAVEGRLGELMSTGGASPVLTEANVGAEYFTSMAKLHEQGHVPGVPLPLKAIHDVLSEPSLPAGRLTGLLSSSGEGKTSLTMQFLLTAAENGNPVCFFSYDQSPEECIRQMVAQKHGISAQQQAEARLSQNEWERCNEFASFIDSSRFKIVSCGREDHAQLVRMCEQFQKRNGVAKPTLFAFDHIGKIQTTSKKELDAGSRAGEINQALKGFMRVNNATGLVLNQRNSYGMSRANPRPISRDFRR